VVQVKVYRAEGLLERSATEDAPDGEYIDLELTIAIIQADFEEEEPADEGKLWAE